MSLSSSSVPHVSPKQRNQRITGLLNEQKRMIQVYAFTICRDFHLSEDVFQEVALVLLARDELPPDESLLPWLKGVIRHKTLDAMKRRRRMILLDAEVLDFLDAEPEELPADYDVELRKRLALCLGRLGGDARRIIEGRYAKNQTCEELAGQLGRTVQGIYAMLKRVRVQLGECLERAGVAL